MAILDNKCHPADNVWQEDLPMTTLNFSLPEELKKWIEAQVASGGYGNTSEYLRELIRMDQKRKAEERLEALLLEGLESPAREMTSADWEDLKRRVKGQRAPKTPVRGGKSRSFRPGSA
jgi:antitoxin ParD1/3/4